MFTKTDYNKLQQFTANNAELKDLIERLLASYQESIRTLSHEIRNPLTMVYSELQMIESAHPEVQTFKYWSSLREDILYTTQLLNDLSEYNNGTSLNISSVDLCSFFKQTALSFAAAATDSKLEFTSYIAPDLPVISADSRKLKSVLINLLKNAAESFPPNTAGSIHLRAALSSSADLPKDIAGLTPSDPCIFIQITDTGCGIPSEYIENIFTPFVTHKQGGTGLGLALAKRIIEAHCGQIFVSSVQDKGTTFTILLPFQASGTDMPLLKNQKTIRQDVPHYSLRNS